MLDRVQIDTNDPLTSNEWDQILTDMGGTFGKDDFEYLGYLEDSDNVYYYKLKDSDIVVSVSILDGVASVEHYDNSISDNYAIVYFTNGMPDNKEEIYQLDFDYNFYITNYDGGDTMQYWLLEDPSNIMEMKVK